MESGKEITNMFCPFDSTKMPGITFWYHYGYCSLLLCVAFSLSWVITHLVAAFFLVVAMVFFSPLFCTVHLISGLVPPPPPLLIHTSSKGYYFQFPFQCHLFTWVFRECARILIHHFGGLQRPFIRPERKSLYKKDCIYWPKFKFFQIWIRVVACAVPSICARNSIYMFIYMNDSWLVKPLAIDTMP